MDSKSKAAQRSAVPGGICKKHFSEITECIESRMVKVTAGDTVRIYSYLRVTIYLSKIMTLYT